MKKLLFIAYFFPPAGGGGVQRSLKFVKYLINFGWVSLVVSAGKGQTDLVDNSLMKDVPKSVKVHHVSSFDPHILFKQGHSKKNIYQANSLIKIKSLIRSFGKLSISLFFVPDEFVFWIFPAYTRAKEVIRKEKPSVILSTSGPVSSHLVAYLLKREFKLPWIADLRDEWADNSYKIVPTPFHMWLDLKLEKVILSRADRIVSVTEQISGSIEKRVGKRVDTILNGYDEEDLIPVRQQKFNGKFIITFTGSFYEVITPRDVLEVLANIVSEGVIKKEKLEINFIGKISVEVLQDIIPFKNDLNINITGYVPHSESLKWVGRSTVLLLVTKRDGSLTGKIFEYINSNKPILAYVPLGGEAGKLLTSIGAKWIVHNGDKKSLKKKIISMYNMWIEGRLENRYSGDTSQFSRRAQTKILAGLLDEITQ